MDFKKYVKKLHKWEKITERFSNKIDDYERVRRHYLGRKLFRTQLYYVLNVFCMLQYPVLLMMNKINTNHNKNKNGINNLETIFICPNDEYKFVLEDLPESVLSEYSNIASILANDYKIPIKGFYLDDHGRELCKELAKRYPFSFFMNCSVMIHIYRIQHLILKFKPSVIITTQTDEDFTTSILTNYCEHLGVKYIGIQHGDYCYDPNLAYFRFSEYYVWDEDSIRNLELVNTRLDFVRTFKCKRFDGNLIKKITPEYHLTYYLAGDEIRNELIRIRNVLIKFIVKGYSVNLRNHPRARNARAVRAVFNDGMIHLENAREVPIGDSITNTDYVVATRSTVLSEALANSLDAVIDDVAYDMEDMIYLRMKNLNHATLRLSDIMKAELGI